MRSTTDVEAVTVGMVDQFLMEAHRPLLEFLDDSSWMACLALFIVSTMWGPQDS